VVKRYSKSEESPEDVGRTVYWCSKWKDNDLCTEYFVRRALFFQLLNLISEESMTMGYMYIFFISASISFLIRNSSTLGKGVKIHG
jgi:hypothetical protein